MVLQSVIESNPLDEEMRLMRTAEAAKTHMLFSAPGCQARMGRALINLRLTKCEQLAWK